MVEILYRHFIITASAQVNPATKFWIGKANIAFAYGRNRLSGTLIGPNDQHASERAAEYFIISQAKDLIEAHLATPTDETVPSE